MTRTDRVEMTHPKILTRSIHVAPAEVSHHERAGWERREVVDLRRPADQPHNESENTA